jgi:hypothetical protein
MIITWYTDGTADGTSGYVNDGGYSTGMRLLFFVETLSPEGKHVFGIWDMHETLAEDYWHFYYDGSTLWPSSSGLSVKWVNEIVIYTAGVCGDADGDGTVTMNDGRQVFMNLIHGADAYPIDPLTADCDGNPGITMNDGRQIFMNLIYGSENYPLQCQ